VNHIFDCSVSDAIYKRELKFLTIYGIQKTLHANCLKNILLTNWILYTDICLVKLFKFLVCCNFFHIQCESKKVAPPPKTFCDVFSPGEPVYLKISLLIAQTYFYVYTNFGPFI